jgi:hypothetical protein
MTRFAFASSNLRRLALPMLSCALALSLTANPASAQAPSKRPPGHVVEAVTSAATVVSTANYQATLTLNCNGGTQCAGEFPAVAGRRRLNLNRMSCFMHSSEYAVYASGKIELRAANGSESVVQFLPTDYSTDWGYHLLNRAIDVHIASRQQIRVVLLLASGGQTRDATCTAHGVLETLQ